jgi:hypothetical protein
MLSWISVDFVRREENPPAKERRQRMKIVASCVVVGCVFGSVMLRACTCVRASAVGASRCDTGRTMFLRDHLLRHLSVFDDARGCPCLFFPLFVGIVSCRLWLFSPTHRCSVCAFQRQNHPPPLSAFRNVGAYLLPSYAPCIPHPASSACFSITLPLTRKSLIYNSPPCVYSRLCLVSPLSSATICCCHTTSHCCMLPPHTSSLLRYTTCAGPRQAFHFWRAMFRFVSSFLSLSHTSRQ